MRLMKEPKEWTLFMEVPTSEIDHWNSPDAIADRGELGKGIYMFAGSYCGSPPSPAEIAFRWNGDPLLLVLLGLGLLVSWHLRNPKAAGGIALLAVAFVSPLCSASVALFSARSLHHLLLITAAIAFAMAFAPKSLERVRIPIVPATIGMTAILWLWHVPALYDAALANMAAYWLMQGTILGSSIVFWISLRQSDAVGAIGGLIGATVQMGFLGALLTFAPTPLYFIHAVSAPAWGMTGLADQQLAGLVMWVAGMAPFALAGGILAARAWGRLESRRPAIHNG